MPRDIGNEIVVAIAAIGVLAFALVFAIVLSLSNAPDAAQTATAGVAIHSTDTPASSAVIPSATIMPSSTPLRVRTSSMTPKPASATALPVQTEPQNTASTSSMSATPLPVLASSSPTRKPADTVTATVTRTPPPTLTFTPTITVTTPPPASNTPTMTLTPTLTEVPNILPTVTGIIPLVPTTSVQIECPPPIGWATYTVQRGDTLFSIARQTNSTVRELQGANCLMNVNAIFAGTPLYVPHLPVSHGSNQPPPLIPITQPPGVPASGLVTEGCTNAQARITNLTAGQTVSGVVTLTGSAAAENFLYYKIEVRPDFAEIFNFYSRSETPVTQGTLAFLDTKLFGSGLYWVRLTVLTNTSTSIPPCTIPVYFG